MSRRARQRARWSDRAVLCGAALASAVIFGAGTVTARAGEQAITYLPKAAVDEAFSQGRPLVENGAFKVHASRREQAGLAEVHAAETDVIYVLQGRATLVTGGEVVAGKTTAPGEVRGEAVRGGTAQTLAPGDVMIVPAGVPHWFQTVEGPFLYYVVKVIEKARGAS